MTPEALGSQQKDYMKQAAPGAALICLLWLGGLGPAAAQYVPTLTVVRSVDSFHVLQNGEFTHLLERDLRIDTQQGVGQEGEQQLSFNSKLETLEILEAYTLQADGTRLPRSPTRTARPAVNWVLNP